MSPEKKPDFSREETPQSYYQFVENIFNKLSSDNLPESRANCYLELEAFYQSDKTKLPTIPIIERIDLDQLDNDFYTSIRRYDNGYRITNKDKNSYSEINLDKEGKLLDLKSVKGPIDPKEPDTMYYFKFKDRQIDSAQRTLIKTESNGLRFPQEIRQL